MAQRARSLLAAGLFSISLVVTPRPAISSATISYSEWLVQTSVVVQAVLLLLGTSPQSNIFDDIVGQVNETPGTGEQTLVSIAINDMLFGESIEYSGSGIIGPTAGDISGGGNIGLQTFTTSIDNVYVDDAANPTMVGWTGITTSLWTSGMSQLPVDVTNTGVSGGFVIDLMPGEITVEHYVVFQDPQRLSFSFDLTFLGSGAMVADSASTNSQLFSVDITTSFGQTASEVVSEVQVTQTVVPVPPAVWLLGSGLHELVAIARHKKVS